MPTDPSELIRSPELLTRRESQLLVIDVQEKFVPHLPVAESLVAGCRRLIRGAGIVGVPVAATEQYPKGLGPTVSALRDHLAGVTTKMRFSCTEVLNWGPAASRSDDRYKVVICGIETHVCVMQTTLDLIAHGYQVYIPADAVASRRKVDWKFALQRMANAGATLTTVEAILFEWCESAESPEFKPLMQLVKEEGPAGGQK